MLGKDDPLTKDQIKRTPILKLFEQITEIACAQVTDIIASEGGAEEGASEREYLSPNDLNLGFTTEEFISKNIRVRPVSGKEVDEKSEGGGRNFASLGDIGDEEDKFNKMQDLEMDDQRKKIKNVKEDLEKKKQSEIDKEAKKSRRK